MFPPDRPASVLAVYAHPDDPEVSCAGTLVRWVAEGAAVHLLICTRGEKGTHDPASDPDDLARTRAAEAGEAAAIMGLAGHEILGYPDGELENSVALRHALVERIRRHRPDVVVAPDPTAVFFGDTYVNHHDHRAVGFAVLDACAPAAASPAYFPDAGPPHHVGTIYLSGTLEPDLWVDVAATIDRKVEALLCHRTQIGDDGALAADVLRRRAAADGEPHGMRFAESFRVVRLR